MAFHAPPVELHIRTAKGRKTELVLLLLAAVFLIVNYLSLQLQQGSTQLTDWSHWVVWFVCAVAGRILLNRYVAERDPIFFPIIMFLSGWGLVVINRLAPNFADRQAVWLIVSIAAMLLVAILPGPLRWLRNYRYILLSAGFLLLIATIFLGRNPSDPFAVTNAPQLWLGFGSVYFQPSEALKIILAAFLASYLAEIYPIIRAEGMDTERRFPLSARVLGPMLVMWGVSIIILVWQRDLGTAILFFIVFLVLLYVASGYHLILLSGAFLIAVAGIVAYRLFDVVQLRIDIWLNPWPEASNRAFQIVQSLLAFASGGTFGQGVGQGSPGYIPVVHSDFVFAAIAEEWGLLGVVGVVACFSILTARGLRCAASQSRRPFYSLLAVGLSTLLMVQSLLIMAGVLKLLPLTGVTLPFLSYGGSSLLASFVITGFLIRLSSVENTNAIFPRS